MDPLVIDMAAGTPRPGQWCDVCALPSVYEVDVYRLTDDGPVRLGTWARCTEHDPHPGTT